VLKNWSVFSGGGGSTQRTVKTGAPSQQTLGVDSKDCKAISSLGTDVTDYAESSLLAYEQATFQINNL